MALLARAAPGNEAELAVRLCGRLAVCYLQARRWWDAVLTAASGPTATAGRLAPDAPIHRTALACHALASAELGFLTRARDELAYLISVGDGGDGGGDHGDGDHGRGDSGEGSFAHAIVGRMKLVEALRSVEARLSAAAGRGAAAAIEAELRRLGGALADRDALGEYALASSAEVGRVSKLIEVFCSTADGRAALRADGILRDEDEDDGGGGGGGGALTARRAAYSHVLYHASRTLGDVSVARSAAGLLLGRPTDMCEPPRNVYRPEAPSLLGPADLATLQRERLVVTDGALDGAVVLAAARELEAMQKRGLLWADQHDLCAPRTQRHNLLLHEGTLHPQLRADAPALAACVEALCKLPLLLHEGLGLDLRVPQTVMCTAMPPGASYKEHLDSNGRDNPRLVTVLLYLSYDPPSGGALRIRTADGAGTRDVFPHPGRVAAFFAQELRHEVLPSEGVRYAMTLWIWQRARDEAGR